MMEKKRVTMGPRVQGKKKTKKKKTRKKKSVTQIRFQFVGHPPLIFLQPKEIVMKFPFISLFP